MVETRSHWLLPSLPGIVRRTTERGSWIALMNAEKSTLIRLRLANFRNRLNADELPSLLELYSLNAGDDVQLGQQVPGGINFFWASIDFRYRGGFSGRVVDGLADQNGSKIRFRPENVFQIL